MGAVGVYLPRNSIGQPRQVFEQYFPWSGDLSYEFVSRWDEAKLGWSIDRWAFSLDLGSG